MIDKKLISASDLAKIADLRKTLQDLTSQTALLKVTKPGDMPAFVETQYRPAVLALQKAHAEFVAMQDTESEEARQSFEAEGRKLLDARKGVRMFEKVGVPILGVAENMSFLEAADGSRQHLFGQGGGLKVATALHTILLGEVPLDQTIRQGGDHGIPVVISHPDGNPARVFRSVGLTVLQGLEKPA